MVAKYTASNLMKDVARAFKDVGSAINPDNYSYIVDHVDIDEVLRELANTEVLVGIPEENGARQSDGEITNPELAFIHTHGVRTTKMREEMNQILEQQQGAKSYSKAYQLYIQQHGSPAWRIPPRPILEPAIEANIEKIAGKLKRAAIAYLEGDVAEGRKQLELTGLAGQNYARKWFVDPRNNWPPNAQSTIQQKGSERPLIDTGELRKSITYVLREHEMLPNRKPLKSLKVRRIKMK